MFVPRRFRQRIQLFVGVFDQRGQATAEYGVVILIAVALGMAVLSLFTGGVFDSFLGSMIKHILETATDRIDF